MAKEKGFSVGIRNHRGDIVPYAGDLQKRNLGRDGEFYWWDVLSSGVPLCARVGASTEEGAKKLAQLVVDHIIGKLQAADTTEKIVVIEITL
jgi:hypothetical protein